MLQLSTIKFKSNQLKIVEETQSIVVKEVCNAMGIDFTRQYRKILSDNSYESKLIKVKTNGGMQEVFTIPLSKLNGWLFSINPNKVKPEVKQKLIEYKKDCFDVLNNYFNKGIAVNQKFFQGKDSQKVIAGLKSGMLRKDKLIERLREDLHFYQIRDVVPQEQVDILINELNNLKSKQKALPNFDKDKKFEIILKRTDELLQKDTDLYTFTRALQTHLKFYREYIEAIKGGDNELEKFKIEQIEIARKLKSEAETREMNLYRKYEDMMSRIRGFIKASNQISLLEPIEKPNYQQE